ncbi:MAG: deoxyribodipyrimidine photo-lyase [Planctomycetota bacterium]|jgi:deoxyribodipyrimidine photo-lyase
MARKSKSGVPEIRVRALNRIPVRAEGKYVLYWMIAARRTHYNFALDRAIELALELDQPLIVLEPLRVGYLHACDRFHRFVIDGMADNAKAFEGTGVLYHPFVESVLGAGEGLLEKLSEDACVVVTDDYPAFFFPKMTSAAAKKISVRLEAVDSNGIYPMRATDRVFARAYDFRRFLQRELAPHLSQSPRCDPLRTKLRPRKRLPQGVGQRWPRVSDALLSGDENQLHELPIDHQVQPTSELGGERAAGQVLDEFLDLRSMRYGQDRNHPDSDGASGLSAYLHFGHLSAHEILEAIADRERWSPEKVSDSKSGKREGWWGMSPAAESFLDQLVTWREIGFNFCAHRDDYDKYESLPEWAQITLAGHSTDPRPQVYTLEQFERAKTHDELWNAAQNQLRTEGRIHNYLRMLWGKKILHWSESPQAALAIMLHLNNKYALDGRDPNSYSGIFWVLGRNDRAWGPEREVFGKIRYMASENTRRKLQLKQYMAKFGAERDLFSQVDLS